MTSRLKGVAAAAALSVLLGACASTGAATSGQSTTSGGNQANQSQPKALAPGLDPAANPDPFPSTYQALPGRPTAFVNANIFDGVGGEIRGGTVLIADGKIVQIGQNVAVPQGYQTIDARGRWITPGIIDAHSHLGVYASPGVAAHSDGNEATDPNTAQVWSEHSLWPQDPGFNTARAGGVTTLHILPGSANLIGGRSVTVRNVPATTYQAMKMPGAPQGLKMACGENPKRVYGGRQRSPATRMANVAGYRRAWIEAADYVRRWDAYREKVERGERADPPTRNLQLDTLAAVLRGEILVQNHCYRADEMAIMLDIAREFGYRIRTFHHGTEAYKLAPVLAREGICVATWNGWWGFKMEALDGIEANVALLHQAGGCPVVHSDDATLTQRLNQEAAAALAAGREAGIQISDADAIRWITSNAAKAIGVEGQTGSLEPGKRADVVLWSANPLSVYAVADQVYVDGALTYDRTDPRFQPKSDFEVGLPTRGAR